MQNYRERMSRREEVSEIPCTGWWSKRDFIHLSIETQCVSVSLQELGKKEYKHPPGYHKVYIALGTALLVYDQRIQVLNYSCGQAYQNTL